MESGLGAGAEGKLAQVEMHSRHCQHWHCQMVGPLVVEPVVEVE
jgi:hypothetical protein